MLVGSLHRRRPSTSSLVSSSSVGSVPPLCVITLGARTSWLTNWLSSQVLNDANLDAAAKAIIVGAFTHSGQICVGTERVIVQRGASDKLIALLKGAAAQMKAGDQSSGSSGAQLGCVFSAASATNIISMISEAVADGATLLAGDVKADGAVVQPPSVLGVKPGQRLWDRESFGQGKYSFYLVFRSHLTHM